jgi:hypothetical protein
VKGRPRRELSTCGHCGEDKKCSRLILDAAVCNTCVLRFARAPKTCPGCDEEKILAFYDAAGRAACATCCGVEAVFGCATCGREDSPYGRQCAPCTLLERAAALLADPSGGIHPQLVPVFDALTAARRPQSTLYWLSRSPGPGLLASMAKGEIEISHAGLDRIPATKAVGNLRDLLSALEVLPAHHPRLEAVTPWLADTLAALPHDHAEIVRRFANWQVLRKLRTKAQRGVLTSSSVENGRASILTVIAFLAWLAEHDTRLDSVTQGDLETYLVEHPGRAEMMAPLITWSDQAKLTAGLQLPTWRRAAPAVVLSDTERWAQVELLLHDESIRLYVRIAGLFTLLFAQPLTRICRMQVSQISQHQDGHVSVNFGSLDIELPEPLDRLVVEQLSRPGQSSFVSQPDHWLFPGGIPGRHLGTETIRMQLVARGIQPSRARKAAMFQLAGEIPTPILADILGLAANTAVRWATIAARDWSHYAAMRRAGSMMAAS